MEYYDNTNSVWESSEYNYDGNFTMEEYDSYGDWRMKLYSVSQGLTTAVGLLTNGFFLILLAMSRRSLTVSNMFLLQRAMGEMLDLITLMSFVVSRETGNYKIDPVLCTTLSISLHVGTVASLVFFMLFTMDSYLSSRPQDHTLIFRNKVMRLTSTTAWLLAAALGVAAYFLTHTGENGICMLGPLFDNPYGDYNFFIYVCFLLVVPLVVVWVFVSVTRPQIPAVPIAGKGQEGPNRRLLIGLASTFTVCHGLYWLVSIFGYVIPSDGLFIVIHSIAMSLPYFNEAINPILVICLSEEMRQKVTGWLSARHSASLPLQDL